MARSDFDNKLPIFITTRENTTDHVFDVDTQPNIIDIDSQLQVNVTASKNGVEDLTANSTSETNPPVTIAPEQDTGGFVDGACCVCQDNGEIICTENVIQQDCLAQGGVWKANTDCTVAACADVPCDGGDGAWQFEGAWERPPVARFTEVPELIQEGDNSGIFHLTLNAEHVDGIEKVVFQLDGGELVNITEKNSTPHYWVSRVYLRN